MERIELAVIGATTAGIAAAKAFGRGSVVFEKGMLPGAEFGAAMYVDPRQGNEKSAFFKELLRMKTADSLGGFHPTGLAQVLFTVIRDADVNVRFFTRVLQAVSTPQGWVLTLYDAEGLHDCIADRVLLTTHDSQPVRKERRWSVKSVSACLCGGETEIAGIRCGDMEVLKGVFSSERILRVFLDDTDDWIQARAKLHAIWKREAEGDLRGWKLASVASQFGYQFDEPVFERLAEGMTFLPSVSFGCPAAAYEGGAACGIAF